MNNMKSIHDITQEELKLGIQGSASWHHQYRKSAYVFIGGLDYNLTEGDILSVFSQYGEIVNINLVRDKKTGKSKGFCFIGYEDQRSTVLAVDNFNGIKLCGRTIRVDHVQQYRRPKDEHGNEIIEKGCAPKTPTPSPSPEPLNESKAKKKSKKTKKEKKKKKKKSKEQLLDDEELKDSSNDGDKQNESIEDGDRKRSDAHHQHDHPSYRRLSSSSPPSQQHDKKLYIAKSRSRSHSPAPTKEQSNKRKIRVRSPLLRQKSNSHSPVREKRERSVDDSPIEKGHGNDSSIRRDRGHSPVRKRHGDYSPAKKMHRDRSPIKERRGDRSPVRERRNEKRSNRSRSPRRRRERSHSRERNQR